MSESGKRSRLERVTERLWIRGGVECGEGDLVLRYLEHTAMKSSKSSRSERGVAYSFVWASVRHPFSFFSRPQQVHPNLARERIESTGHGSSCTTPRN